MQHRFSLLERSVGAFHSIRRDLAHAVRTLYISASSFRTCGVSLARGPACDPAIDDSPSVEPRVVLSYDFWRSRIASDPDIFGEIPDHRRRELALRMALGSTRLRVFRLMLSDIGRRVIPGVAGGLFPAAVLIRTMADVMGTPLTVGPTPLGLMEPLIYALASTLAVSIALLAGLPASLRATSVQPMVAMRSE